MVADRILAEKRDLDDVTIRYIDRLHGERNGLYIDMQCTEEPDFELIERWRTVQKLLQIAWGFELDEAKFHEYNLPHCECPVLDNKEMGGHYWFSGDCPIHGGKEE